MEGAGEEETLDGQKDRKGGSLAGVKGHHTLRRAGGAGLRLSDAPGRLAGGGRQAAGAVREEQPARPSGWGPARRGGR